MRSNRMKRVDDVVREVLAEALLTKVADPKIGMVSVTKVEVSPEFDTAKVWFTVLGGPEQRESTLEGLRRAAGFLRSELGREVRMRRIPQLRFVYDDSVDRGFRVDETLRELEREREAGEAAPEAGENGEEPHA